MLRIAALLTNTFVPLNAEFACPSIDDDDVVTAIQNDDDFLAAVKMTRYQDDWESFTTQLKHDSWLSAIIKAKEFETSSMKINKRDSFKDSEAKPASESSFNTLNQLRKESVDALARKNFESKRLELRKKLDPYLDVLRKEREEKERIQREEEHRCLEEKRLKEEHEKKMAMEKQQQLELEKRKDAEKRERLEQQKRDEDKQKEEDAAENAKNMNCEAEKNAESSLNLIQKIKSEVGPSIMSSMESKKYCFKQKMVVIQKIGQVTNLKQDIIRIAKELHLVLSDARSKSIPHYQWFLDFVAKQVVKQAQNEVSINIAKAFPLAHICLYVMDMHVDFIEVLMGRLYKKCPFLIPKYPRKKQAQSMDEYMKSAGYRRRDNDEWETEAQYAERICGVVALFIAICQAVPMDGIRKKLGMNVMWKWMAQVLNMRPRAITPDLMATALEVGGHQFLQVYRQQAHKLLQYICHVYIPMIPKEGVAATTRLTIFLEKYVKSGMIPMYEGSAITTVDKVTTLSNISSAPSGQFSSRRYY